MDKYIKLMTGRPDFASNDWASTITEARLLTGAAVASEVAASYAAYRVGISDEWLKMSFPTLVSLAIPMLGVLWPVMLGKAMGTIYIAQAIGSLLMLLMVLGLNLPNVLGQSGIFIYQTICLLLLIRTYFVYHEKKLPSM